MPLVYFHRVAATAVLSLGLITSAIGSDTLTDANRYQLQGDQSRYQLQTSYRSTSPQMTPKRLNRFESDYRPIQTALRNAPTARFLQTQATSTPLEITPGLTSSVNDFREMPIPYEVSNHLTKAGIPLSSVGMYVKELSGSERVLLSVNPTQPMNPASTMKLVTTYAAIEIMGGQHQWTTTVYRDGQMIGDTLHGNLIFKGTGDPKITAENFHTMLEKVQEAGIRHITGDIILDRSHFTLSPNEQRSFDGASTKSYNVGADALMMGYKSLQIRLSGDPVAQAVDVRLFPHPKQVELVSDVAYDRICGDWLKKIKSTLTPKPEGGYRLTVRGRYSSECGEQFLKPIALANADMVQFFGGVFENEWENMGGSFNGYIREGLLSASAVPVVIHRSDPLHEIVSTTNKISHNMFAKQIFYSLGAKHVGTGSNVEKSSTVIQEWLQAKGLYFPELVMENGSGLSRIERISAQSLGQLLEKAAYSPMADVFMQSLPVVGVDGTMARRLTNRPVTGRAFIKTGTLRDVKAVAGYVQSITKRNYVVVFIINHPKAPTASGIAAQDRLIEWVYFDGPGADYPAI